MERIEAQARLWRWQSATGPAAWYFLTIEGAAADAIRVAAMGGQWLDRRPGFGSAKVHATIGATSWRTSVFPDRTSGGWLLPVKKAVRDAEGLVEGEMVSLDIAL
jgi:hypothetical protein